MINITWLFSVVVLLCGLGSWLLVAVLVVGCVVLVLHCGRGLLVTWQRRTVYVRGCGAVTWSWFLIVVLVPGCGHVSWLVLVLGYSLRLVLGCGLG